MSKLRREMRAGTGGAHPPSLRASVRVWLLAAVLAGVLVGDTVPVEAESGEGSASFGLQIPTRTIIKHAICIEPPFGEGGDDRPIGSVIQVSVATNVPGWGLAVRLGLPGGRKLELRPEAVTCRLRDGSGVVIREKPVEDGQAFLQGNGECGSFEFFLELAEGPAGEIAAKHPDLVIHIEGLKERDLEERHLKGRDR